MSTPVCGVGAIVMHEGAILLVKRGREPSRGQWSLPGGRVQTGETLYEALAREVREETAIEITIDGLCGVAERILRDDEGAVEFHYVILDYYASPVTTDVVAGDDADDARWVPVDQIAEFQLTAGLVEFLADRGILARGRARIGR
ncbi:MAG: NUDIX hydrolase [Actinomycetota bacterium]|nr:NUDIX hydrolase [Actinomycetota bacterium]